MEIHGWIQEMLVNNEKHIRGNAWYGDLEFDVLIELTPTGWAIKVGDLCVAFPGVLDLSHKLQSFEIPTHRIILKKKSKATVFVLTNETKTITGQSSIEASSSTAPSIGYARPNPPRVLALRAASRKKKRQG